VLYLIELLKKCGSPVGKFLLSADNARFSEERAKYESLMKILEFSIFSENLGLMLHTPLELSELWIVFQNECQIEKFRKLYSVRQFSQTINVEIMDTL